MVNGVADGSSVEREARPDRVAVFGGLRVPFNRAQLAGGQPCGTEAGTLTIKRDGAYGIKASLRGIAVVGEDKVPFNIATYDIRDPNTGLVSG